jgi:hypothetical protein
MLRNIRQYEPLGQKASQVASSADNEARLGLDGRLNIKVRGRLPLAAQDVSASRAAMNTAWCLAGEEKQNRAAT